MIHVKRLITICIFIMTSTLISHAAFPVAKEATIEVRKAKKNTSRARRIHKRVSTPKLATPRQLFEKMQGVASESYRYTKYSDISPEYYSKPKKKRSNFLGAVLALLLGSLGIHDFYFGKNQNGFIKLAISLIGLIGGALLLSLISSMVVVPPLLEILVVALYVGVIAVRIWAWVDFFGIVFGYYKKGDGIE